MGFSAAALQSRGGARENSMGAFNEYGRAPKSERLRRLLTGTLLLSAAMLFVFLAPGFAAPSSPQAPSSLERLILKDGSYQIITRYKMVGNRVRFYSAERAEWEEIPADLVNWPATKKWNEDHGQGEANPTSSSAEAAALDREEQQERSATPQVAPGLDLPDQQGVWALDTFHAIPELVQLSQGSGNVNQQTGHNIDRQSLDSRGGLKKRIEMNGARSHVQLHVSQPPLYVSLTVPNAPAGEDAFTVNSPGAAIYGGAGPTGGGGPAVSAKDSESSPKSRYVIVRVISNYRHNYRTVSPFALTQGSTTSNDDVIPTTEKILPGGNWMELTPAHPLRIGEYALMEILKPGKVNASVWDFRIDPQGPENQDAIRPIKQTLNQP